MGEAITEAALQEAREAVERATARAQVDVRPLTATDDLAATEALLARVWEHPPGSVELDITLLAALARSGNYVVGAFRAKEHRDTGVGDTDRGDTELIGATAAFLCDPFPTTLYSHVTGVDRGRALPGTGGALKAYQRLWCLERGITGVRWTFDALQARNARLNMGRLGADWVSFHVDYYGALRDGLNKDTGSDRLLLHWDLTRTAADRATALGRAAADRADSAADRADSAADRAAPMETLLARGPQGEPVVGSQPTAYARLEIPTDIDGLRASDPELAQRWRDTLRELLPELIASGRHVVDFDGGGAYVTTPPQVMP